MALLQGFMSQVDTAFDIENDIAWDYLYWASGSEFQALGLSDGGEVTSWPDEVGSADLSGGGVQYRASVAALNSKPAVQGDGTVNTLEASSLTLTYPFTVIAVMTKPTGNFKNWMAMEDAGSAHIQCLYSTNTGVGWYGGDFPGGGTDNAASGNFDSEVLVEFDFYGDGTTPNVINVNNADTGSSTDNAGGSPDQLHLFANEVAGNDFDQGHIAFFGIKANGVLSASDKGSIRTWASDFYGLTIS